MKRYFSIFTILLISGIFFLSAKEKNIAVLSSLHDLNQAMNFGDKFFFLKNGAVKYAGGKEIIREDVIRDIFDIDVRIVEIEKQKVIIGGNRK